MGFSESEKASLLVVKGVGPKVIERLEQLGYDTLPKLAAADAAFVCKEAAVLVGTTCWGNSPQARAAVQGAIERARMINCP